VPQIIDNAHGRTGRPRTAGWWTSAPPVKRLNLLRLPPDFTGIHRCLRCPAHCCQNAKAAQYGDHTQARHQVAGSGSTSRSFLFKADAEAWARQREAEIDRGELRANRGALRSITLGGLLQRYGAEISPTKKGCESEVYRVRAMRANAIAHTTLDKLTTARLALFRDVSGKSRRLASGANWLC
jgi:hypothetical protein